jgi:hypothetical protein
MSLNFSKPLTNLKNNNVNLGAGFIIDSSLANVLANVVKNSAVKKSGTPNNFRSETSFGDYKSISVREVTGNGSFLINIDTGNGLRTLSGTNKA